jgi:hypothetical protein
VLIAPSMVRDVRRARYNLLFFDCEYHVEGLETFAGQTSRRPSRRRRG